MRENNKGITLIALVITIIVMLLLVGVTISMAVNGGLFNYAGKATKETKNALNAEQQLANGGIEVDGVWYSSINEYLNKDKERISQTESYVGYYADVDGNGTVDGVIYADLAFDKSGEWSADDLYTINKETDLKDYYVSKANYEGDFGTKDVLTSIGEGNDRFYVMALSDISTSTYTLYNSKLDDEISNISSTNFGTGKTNTANWIEIWNSDEDEDKSNNDVWGQIQTQVNNGWFLPSRDEWSAFADALNISTEQQDERYYISCGLADSYWSSTQYAGTDAYVHVAFFNRGTSHHIAIEAKPNLLYRVRLSTTF